jgi:hypothetical protein
MHREIRSVYRRHLDEERRYFPEWAQRPAVDGEEVEADRNSYSAGGYAEEFGYCAHRGYARGVRIHDGVAIEESAVWFYQSHSIHPGYPEEPIPPVSRTHLEFEQSESLEHIETPSEFVHPHEHASTLGYRSTHPHRYPSLHWRERLALRLANGIWSWMDRLRTSR